MLKIAHIALDEKFIEAAADIFELAWPQQNHFYIISPKPWRYLKERTIYQSLSKKEMLQYILTKRSELKAYDVVILHGLPTAWLIPMVLLKQSYVWLGWGYDYYNRSFDDALLVEPLILPKTLECLSNQDNVGSVNFSWISLIKLMAKKILESGLFYKLAMRNLKVFSPVLPEEYELVKQKYGLGKNTRYFPWNYGILEKHLAKNIQLDGITNANSILLGNSATPTNNHLEALDVILNSGSERAVYIPLSYGSVPYARLVKEYIRSKPVLSAQCKVLDTFVPLDEYNAIINNCGFVIMNHVRQQALGNIVAMMYRGAKIFLREESILYKHFKEKNAYIYSVQELELDKRLLNTHLTIQQINHNRTILNATWSEPVILERTRNLVSAALGI